MNRRLPLLLLGLVGLLLAAGAVLYTPDLDRRVLEDRYGVGPGDYREVAGVRLHLRVEGPADGPALVLIHGFGASLQTWDAWAAGLADRYRVIRFDLPGFGLTGPDPTGDYSDARSVAVLRALLDDLGVDRAGLVGNSLGGQVAWAFAAALPDRVDRLVLIAPGGFLPPEMRYGEPVAVPAPMRAMVHILPRSLVRATLEPLYGDPAALTPALVDRYHDMLRAPGVRAAMVDRLGQYVLHDPRPSLARITAPTLILWGERDVVIPVANAADFAAALPADTLVTFPTLGHMPQEEAPEASLSPVRAFLP